MKRLSLLICAGVAMSTLSGCASEPTVAPPTAAPKTPVTTHQADDAAAAEETPAAVDLATCLHGTWLADNAFFLAAIQQFGPEVQDVSGRVLLEFASDGTLTTEYQDWTIFAVSEGMEMQIVRTGVDTGTYTVGDHSVDVNETHMGSTLTMKQGGTEFAIAPQPAVYAGAGYSCSASTATLETVDGTLQLERN